MTVKELRAQLDNLTDDMVVTTIDSCGDLVPVTEVTYVTKQDIDVDDREIYRNGYLVIS
jgi:hypothetical protein